MTLADIFASQGYAEKALKIYRDVLRRQPNNSDVAQKIAALERGEPIVRSHVDEHAEDLLDAAVPPPPAPNSPPPSPSVPVPSADPAAAPGHAPALPAGAAIDEGRSYEQFKRWLRTVSD